MTNEELNTALYILHRKADVDRGAASGVGLLHGYLSEDDAMLGAEAQYCRMEQELQS